MFQDRFKDRLANINRTDPNEVPVPPYHFDTPLIRKLWARYYDVVSLMDQQVGELLQQLAEDGLMENTLIFYYSDHGTGMPRSKRALYDSGLRVPLIIKAPKHLQEELGLIPGTTTEELVSFADFAPTLLHVLKIPIPPYMQGIPFLGPPKKRREPTYLDTPIEWMKPMSFLEQSEDPGTGMFEITIPIFPLFKRISTPINRKLCRLCIAKGKEGT